jgi:hypothetical protein
MNGTRIWGTALAAVIISSGVGCGGGSSTAATGGNGGHAQTTGQGGAGNSATGGHGATSTGGTSGGGTFTTSVPSGTKLTSLTPAQGMQLCNDLNTYFQGTLTPVLCKESGVEAAVFLQAFQSAATDAQLQMACQQAYNDCLNPDGGATTTTGNCDPSSEPATCQATVGDLKTCVDDQTTAYQQLSASLPSCSSLTAAKVATFVSSGADGGTTTGNEPASCTKFDSTCSSMTKM